MKSIVLSCGVFAVLLTLESYSYSDESISFNRDIRPILAKHCLACHGPDEAAREAGLRLDIVDPDLGPFAARDLGPAIVPHSLEDSQVWLRISSDDEDLVMPPLDDAHPRLTKDEITKLRSWILDGAKYDLHWAFVAPEKQNLDVLPTKWPANRIDFFVKRSLNRNNLEPKAAANKRTLIRRLTLDLTGLPPTVEEIHQYLNDESADAYRDLVDRLLSSPAYGEHMARYWLDLVRFADTNGIHHDHYREMTPYRDWVIRAFNENLPFDQFIVDQVAGDLHEAPTQDQLIASGFNRLHLVIDRGTAIPQESFTRNVIDRVNAVGTAFLGLTVGCAVCHDHKYDPITQKDFYQLYAFFNNIDSEPESPGRNTHAPFIRLPSKEQSLALTTSNKRIKEQEERVAALEAELTEAGHESEAPEAKEATERVGQELAKAKKELQILAKRKSALEKAIPVSLVMKERKDVRPTHILIRGAYDQPGEMVERNTPGFLPPIQQSGRIKSRMDLAKWLVDSSHPLTARVTTNRIWQQFLGVGLVKTSEDFGTQGELPSHPNLLDDLSIRFIESGWDVKQLVRSIVMSSTYRQTSVATANEYEQDSENRNLSRGSRYRLDAEVIRDQILVTAGMLNGQMFGKSVKPPQPPNLWKNVSMVSSSTYEFKADQGEKIHRRSLYSFWKRALPPPQMTIFDAPTREACTARRERTNTPLQALVLMNEQRYFDAAFTFASKLLKQGTSDTERLTIAYETITSHLPTDDELQSMSGALKELTSTYEQAPDVVNGLLGSNAGHFSSNDRALVAAYTIVVNALYNLDRVKTRE